MSVTYWLLTMDEYDFCDILFFVTAVVYSVQSVMGFFYMSPNLDSGVRPISAVTLAFNSRSATSSSLSTAETWWPEIGDAKRAYIQSDSTWGSTDLTPQHIRKLNLRQTGPGRSLVSTIALFILQYSRYVQWPMYYNFCTSCSFERCSICHFLMFSCVTACITVVLAWFVEKPVAGRPTLYLLTILRPVSLHVSTANASLALDAESNISQHADRMSLQRPIKRTELAIVHIILQQARAICCDRI